MNGDPTLRPSCALILVCIGMPIPAASPNTDRNIDMCTIYIIRHGQTDLNKKHVLQSRIDAPLNDDGIMQAEDAGERLRSDGIFFDMIFSSPLKRAVQTARIIAGDDVPLQIDDRLLEMDYGPYEGVDLTSPPPEITLFFSDFVNNPAPEGMETLDSVVERAGQFLEHLKNGAPGGSILISTHAIMMKGLLEYLTPDSGGSYWATYIKNCDIYVSDLKDGAFTVPKPLWQTVF